MYLVVPPRTILLLVANVPIGYGRVPTPRVLQLLFIVTLGIFFVQYLVVKALPVPVHHGGKKVPEDLSTVTGTIDFLNTSEQSDNMYLRQHTGTRSAARLICAAGFAVYCTTAF